MIINDLIYTEPLFYSFEEMDIIVKTISIIIKPMSF